MSGLASFYLVDVDKIHELKVAAVPTKKGLIGIRDHFHDYLEKNAVALPLDEYDRPGHVLASLLVYLKKHQAVDLLDSGFGDVATAISTARGVSAVILTEHHKIEYRARLDPRRYDVNGLMAFSKEFYELTNHVEITEAAQAMLDSLRVLQEELAHAGPKKAVLLIIE